MADESRERQLVEDYMQEYCLEAGMLLAVVAVGGGGVVIVVVVVGVVVVGVVVVIVVSTRSRLACRLGCKLTQFISNPLI
jgi:uncharacterized protein (DUF983 family)